MKEFLSDFRYLIIFIFLAAFASWDPEFAPQIGGAIIGFFIGVAVGGAKKS